MCLFSTPSDYAVFEVILAETIAAINLRICAFCIMPNHWHFVVWPESANELAQFFQRLTVTHATRWQRRYERVGLGHVYQGRFKSFPVQEEIHFYQVVRYVERNPVRAHLVSDAGKWRWSSLWIREHGSDLQRKRLSKWPAEEPRDWRALVNQPQTEAELAALQRCVRRGSPFGEAGWVDRVVRELGLQSTVRPRGRPSNN
jgi:putative transposase